MTIGNVKDGGSTSTNGKHTPALHTNLPTSTHCLMKRKYEWAKDEASLKLRHNSDSRDFETRKKWSHGAGTGIVGCVCGSIRCHRICCVLPSRVMITPSKCYPKFLNKLIVDLLHAFKKLLPINKPYLPHRCQRLLLNTAFTVFKFKHQYYLKDNTEFSAEALALNDLFRSTPLPHDVTKLRQTLDSLSVLGVAIPPSATVTEVTVG